MNQAHHGGIWPIPKFYFAVDLGAESGLREVPFQEVSGLDMEPQIIEHRAGNDTQFSALKMPGLAKSANVTMNKGLIADDQAFWEWYGKFNTNTIVRTTVTIKLLDEAGAPQVNWVLTNAWPVKISFVDLQAEGTEVAIETLELMYETMTQKA